MRLLIDNLGIGGLSQSLSQSICECHRCTGGVVKSYREATPFFNHACFFFSVLSDLLNSLYNLQLNTHAFILLYTPCNQNKPLYKCTQSEDLIYCQLHHTLERAPYTISGIGFFLCSVMALVSTIHYYNTIKLQYPGDFSQDISIVADSNPQHSTILSTQVMPSTQSVQIAIFTEEK